MSDEFQREGNINRLVEDISAEVQDFIEVGDYVNAQSLVEQVKRLDREAGDELQRELDTARKQTEY